MAGCVLRVSGANFGVDDFVAGTGLAPCRIWHRGDRTFRNRPASETSGFNVTISEAEELPAQVTEAIQFLDRHRIDLLRASSTPDVDDMTLDFGIPRRDVAAQFDEFPASMVQAAAEFRMSLALSQYLVDETRS